MNNKKTVDKKPFNLLILLLAAQVLMLLFSVYWMIKYYTQTLIPSLDLFQIFSALGCIGRVSSVFSLVIIGITLHAVFIKKNESTSVFFLGLLFFQSTFFFITGRLYEIFFMYISVLIVVCTFVWINFLLVACVSCVGLVLSFLILMRHQR